MKQVFTDEALQNVFEQTKKDYEEYRKIVAKQVDCANPVEIVNHMTELASVLALGVTCKAKFQFLTEKLSFQKCCSFYNGICEMLIRECHYKIEMLRSALSYNKQEMQSL